jgi:CheY-like chemotaxis protein
VSNARLAANDDQEQPLLRGRNERILLVEDDEAVRASAKKILEQCGYRVLAAPDGAQALALFEQLHRRLDLVLADVGLPGMSGPKLVEEIRKRQPMIKVLFMSGHIDPAQVGAEDWRRAAELIRKPFPPEALARRVREVLEGRGARA